MNKTFYKRKNHVKVFFDKRMVMRSLAFGSKVTNDFLEWQRYYNEERSITPDRFILSSQKSIYRPEPGGVCSTAESVLPPLFFDSMRFTVGEDGWAFVNGSRTPLNLGTELKAWAILTAPEPDKKHKYLCVIGKPNGEQTPKLCLYPITRKGPAEHAELWVEVEHSMSATSFLICLGRHIFTVHNAKLDYLYCDFEHGELDHIGIGDDAPNTESPWCQLVEPYLITNGTGAVFWLSEDTVYSIPIGFPKRLSRITGDARERTVSIAGADNALLIQRKNKNTSQSLYYRYVRSYNGEYVGSPLREKPTRGF